MSTVSTSEPASPAQECPPPERTEPGPGVLVSRPTVRGTVVWVQRQLVNLAAALGALAVLALLVAVLLGLRPAVVVTGSMAPEIPTGALVVSRPVPADSVQPGDVVTVQRHRGGGLVTHRVVSVAASAEQPGVTSLELKGDANVYADPLPYLGTEVQHVVLSLPGVGAGVLWLQDHLFLVVLALLAATALVRVPAGRLSTGARPTGAP